MKELKGQIEKKVYEIVLTKGFLKKRVSYFKIVENENIPMLKVDMKIRGKKENQYLEINLYVGVVHTMINNMIVDLLELPMNKSKVLTPTLGLQIGYIMPDNLYKLWFVDHKNYDEILDNEIIPSILNYAIPFQEKMTDLKNYYEAIKIGIRGTSSNFTRLNLPILHYMMGEKEKGMEYIRSYIHNKTRPLSESEKKYQF